MAYADLNATAALTRLLMIRLSLVTMAPALLRKVRKQHF